MQSAHDLGFLLSTEVHRVTTFVLLQAGRSLLDIFSIF